MACRTWTEGATYASMLLDSPLLPTDHRDSPRTVSSGSGAVNALTTTCRAAVHLAPAVSPTSCGCARHSPRMQGWNVIVPNISLDTAARTRAAFLTVLYPLLFS